MAKKHLGQNFLVDTNMIEKISSRIVLMQNNIEIGPGKGSLTRSVQKLHAHSAIKLIEKDSTLAKDFIQNGFETIVNDCLECDLNCDVIFSSLPYNISSKFLLKLCEEVKYKRVYLILQIDFIDRILCMGGKNYGALSVLAQLHAHLERHFTIPKECFRPIPQVTSGFLEMNYKRNLSLDFINFVFRCFAARRKKLSNIVNVECEKRPDQISPLEYEQIYKSLTGKEICAAFNSNVNAPEGSNPTKQ